MNRPLIVIYGTVILDAIGSGLIFPILPRLLQSVTGVGDIAPYVGGIYALFALMQFVFSPVLGAMSDRFGRRPVLLVALGGASIDYLLLTFAPELWMLVVGRAIAGLTAANMAIATAYITDITPEAQRPQRFGWFHAMFGVGFIIGPILGGVLGDVWVRAPFAAAAVLNTLNFLVALFVLPESRLGSRGAPLDWASLNPLKPLGWALSMRSLLPLIGVFFVFSFNGQMYGTVWALFGQDAFHWNGVTVGLSLAGFGLFHALVQVFLPGPFTRWFGERNAMFIGVGAESLSLIAIAFATQGWVVFVLLPLFALSGVGVPALQSLATRQVGADQQGQLQGVLASTMSLANIFGPLFFGAVYAASPGWPGLIWLVGVGVYLLGVPLLLRVRGSRTLVEG